MNISIQSFNTQNNYKPNFRAMPLAKYSFHETGRDIYVLKLEKKDVVFLKHISENLKKFFNKYEITDGSPRQVVEEAVNAGIRILQNENEDKADILLATADSEPSAILIGNVLKRDKKGNLHYSSRRNHSKCETELDWLVSWNKKILGEGKVIVSEFFHRAMGMGFKQVYVRSEIPENSSALDFYQKMGFDILSNEMRKLQRKNENSYLIGNDYDESSDLIIPMKATRQDIRETLEMRKREFKREELKYSSSIDLQLEEL